MSGLNTIYDRLVRAKSGRYGFDYLISSADPSRPLATRLEWLVELLEWMRTRPNSGDASRLDFASGHAQMVRLRHLLQTLDRNPTYKHQIAKTLRSILRDIDALEVFRSTGLPGGHGLWTEAASRFTQKLIPAHTDGKDLGEAFEVLFPHAADAAWLAQLDLEMFRALGNLLYFEIGPDELPWNSLIRDMAEALFLLSCEAQSLGLSPLLRRRRHDPHTSKFIPLEEATEEFVGSLTMRRFGGEKIPDLPLYLAHIEACRSEIVASRGTIQQEGVSLNLVYTMTRLEAILTRMDTLAIILHDGGTRFETLMPFLSSLVMDTFRHRSLRALWNDNALVLSRRITERNADTGHHYITRNRSEYSLMIRQAAGGGLVTGATVIIKLFVSEVALSYLLKGLIASINYSVSFLVIQSLGFTLATKQPAMTAPVIAAHMTNLKDDRELAKLIREVVHLIRSQVAAIFGNIFGVIPAAVALHIAFTYVTGHATLTNEEAMQVLKDHSIFGWSPLFAAFTGVLLWLSSLIAGWTDNWVALNNIPRAIRGNRRLRFLFGPRLAGRLADFSAAWASTIGGNVSLGFLLGLTPKALAFAGIALDVRHVTLSAGTIAFAAATIGQDVWRQHAFWQAVSCIGVIGLLNVGVSFGLAMAIAIRARAVTTTDRRRIYRALWSRIARRPMQILLPVGLD